ncbi:MAG: flippase-like domain-containing protein, partial [Candidatus Cloacimonetes bacterium]|nr:flippase-like domain-containing protein [Candidatus Cloacimonadota bacterium]
MKILNCRQLPVCWRKFLLPLKILISGLIFYLLFRKLDLTQLQAGFVRTGLEIVLFLLFTAIFKMGLLYVNWRKFLHFHSDYRASGGEVRRSFLIGEALRFLIPGGYGMIGKIFFVRNSRSSAALSVALEKFFQIW